MRALCAALLLAATASAVEPPALDKLRTWKAYDPRARGAVDFAQVCDMARLGCGLVAPAGERLSAPEGRIRGETIGALLDRIRAAHPEYEIELADGALNAFPRRDGCLKALARKAGEKKYPIASARMAGYMLLAASGWKDEAAPRLASLKGEDEDASFATIELYAHEGARVRQALNRIAQADGRMMWTAETDGRKCRAFTFEAWRLPDPIVRPSTLVSVAPDR